MLSCLPSLALGSGILRDDGRRQQQAAFVYSVGCWSLVTRLPVFLHPGSPAVTMTNIVSMRGRGSGHGGHVGDSAVRLKALYTRVLCPLTSRPLLNAYKAVSTRPGGWG